MRLIITDNDFVPLDARKIIRYQIILLFAIAAGVGMGAVALFPRLTLEVMMMQAHNAAMASELQEQSNRLASMTAACFLPVTEDRKVAKFKPAKNIGGEHE